MKRTLGMIMVLAALTAVVSGLPGAQASHCDSQVVVFGYTAGATALNEGAAVCILDPQDHVVDTRIINPGSTAISIRYLAGGPDQVAVVNGFGYEDLTVPLLPHKGSLGTTWDSDPIDIDPTLIDAVTVQILDVDLEVLDQTCFHTLGGTCDDFESDI